MIPIQQQPQQHQQHQQQQHIQQSILSPIIKPYNTKLRSPLRPPTKITPQLLQAFTINFEQYYQQQMALRKSMINETGEQHNIDPSTVYYYFKEWLRDPTLKIAHQSLMIKPRDTFKDQVINNRLANVLQIIKINPFLTLKEITQQMIIMEKDQHPTQINQKINITKIMRMLNYRNTSTTKVSKTRNSDHNINQRYQYCVRYNQYLQNQTIIMFYDESLFNRYFLRDRGWSKPNQPVKYDPINFQLNTIGLLAIHSVYGFQYYRSFEDYFTKDTYLQQLQSMLCQMDKKLMGQHKILVMKNNIFEKYQQILSLMQKYNCTVQFFPPESPQLNPVDNWIMEVKQRLRHKQLQQYSKFKCRLQKLLKQYRENVKFKNYHYDVGIFVEKGIKKQLF